MGIVIFDGRSSKNYGIQVEHPPGYQTPARDYEMVHIPGRNGDLLIDNGSYQNVSREYEIAVGSEDGDFTEMANRIAEWLYSTSGYARLEDSYEPGYYRMAACQEGITVENLEQHAGRAKVVFNCKPQRFLKSGEEIVEVRKRVHGLTVTFSDDTTMLEGSDYLEIIYSDGGEMKRLCFTSSENLAGKQVFIPNRNEFYIYWHFGEGVRTYYYYGFTVTRVEFSTGVRDPNAEPGALPPDKALSKPVIYVSKGNYPKSPWITDEEYGRELYLLWKYTYGAPTINPPLGNNIANPTGFTALPVITVYGNGAGFLHVNGYTVDISDIRGSITIDSEVQDAYSGGVNRVNRNPDISLGTHGFPKLKPGLNEITFSGGVTYLEVVPKWWTL